MPYKFENAALCQRLSLPSTQIQESCAPKTELLISKTLQKNDGFSF